MVGNGQPIGGIIRTNPAGSRERPEFPSFAACSSVRSYPPIRINARLVTGLGEHKQTER